MDKQFTPYCLGGRRGFGIGKFYDCLQQAKANKLYWIVKTDVKDYFSSINLDLLNNILKSKFKIPRDVREILFKLLTIGIGEIEPRGILIGNPLGKLLGNVYLSLLDDFLLNKSMFFVRFIDDVCIFCKNKKSAEKIFLELKEFLNSKLNLAVAENKTGIYHLYFNRFEFLGFEVVGNSFSPSQENVKRFKERIICLPREYKNKGLKKFIKRINSLVYNFGHLYKRGSVCKLFKQLDEVVRNRVREYFKLSSNGKVIKTTYSEPLKFPDNLAFPSEIIYRLGVASLYGIKKYSESRNSAQIDNYITKDVSAERSIAKRIDYRTNLNDRLQSRMILPWEIKVVISTSLKGSDENNCTLIFKDGLLTAETCP